MGWWVGGGEGQRGEDMQLSSGLERKETGGVDSRGGEWVGEGEEAEREEGGGLGEEGEG